MNRLVRPTLIAAASFAVAASAFAQHTDVLVYEDAGDLRVGQFDYVTFSQTEQRVFIEPFGGSATTGYGTNAPGFTTNPNGSFILPPDADLFFRAIAHEDLGYNLAWWDGQDSDDPGSDITWTDVSFGQVPAGEGLIIARNLGAGQWAEGLLDGGTGSVEGFDNFSFVPIDDADSGGNMHKHIPFLIRGSDQQRLDYDPVPSDGVYIITLQMTSPGYTDSKPVFLTLGLNVPQPVLDEAGLWAQYQLSNEWMGDATGNWHDASRWTEELVPNQAGVVARLTDRITTAATVTVDADATVGRLIFDDADGYTLTGPGVLTLDGNSSIEVKAGSHDLAGTVKLADPTTLTVDPGASLSITGTVDVADQELLIDGISAATVEGWLATGYASGNWNGTGLNTSEAGSDFALGWADTVDGVLVRHVLKADATLDGRVDIDDVDLLIVNFGATDGIWSRGDFTYDNIVDIDDVDLLINLFGVEATAVPEPGTMAALGCVGGLLLRRRR